MPDFILILEIPVHNNARISFRNIIFTLNILEGRVKNTIDINLILIEDLK